MEERRMGLYVQVVIYILLTTSGLMLVKSGTLNIGVVSGKLNVDISFITMLGMLFYCCSFLLYMVILQKFDLSFIIPVTTGVIYVVTFLAGVFFFKESVSMKEVIAASLIFCGVLLMVIDIK